MTGTDVRGKVANKNGPHSDGRRKAVLYCPVCGHESATDGNWDVAVVETQQEFSCPECGRVVAVR